MCKNVLIIGASGDIGAAIVKRVAKEGHQLVLHCHTNQTIINDLSNEIEEGQLLQIIQADLTKKSGIDSFLNALVFPVDAVIFASGKAVYGLFQSMEDHLMDEMLNLHVKAPWIITKHLLPEMIKKQAGKIIVISSVWGETGASNEVLYSSVKGAANTFVKALAKETGPNGVTVHAVSPGFIETKMNQTFTEEEREEIFENISLNRPGLPSEVAEVVHYILNSENGFLNGQNIHVDGGWLV